jgi:hypothetical protein
LKAGQDNKSVAVSALPQLAAIIAGWYADKVRVLHREPKWKTP